MQINVVYIGLIFVFIIIVGYLIISAIDIEKKIKKTTNNNTHTNPMSNLSDQPSSENEEMIKYLKEKFMDTDEFRIKKMLISRLNAPIKELELSPICVIIESYLIRPNNGHELYGKYRKIYTYEKPKIAITIKDVFHSNNHMCYLRIENNILIVINTADRTEVKIDLSNPKIEEHLHSVMFDKLIKSIAHQKEEDKKAIDRRDEEQAKMRNNQKAFELLARKAMIEVVD